MRLRFGRRRCRKLRGRRGSRLRFGRSFRRELRLRGCLRRFRLRRLRLHRRRLRGCLRFVAAFAAALLLDPLAFDRGPLCLDSP